MTYSKKVLVNFKEISKINASSGSSVQSTNTITSKDLDLSSSSGIAIRLGVKDLRVMGRATQGVKLINLKNGDSIAAVAKVMHEEEDEELDETIENIEAPEDGTTLDNTEEDTINDN
jgi:DNA gyrase subunit A